MPCGLLVATLGVALGDRILFLPPPIQPFSPAGGSPAIDAGVYAASPGGGTALEGPSLTTAPAHLGRRPKNVQNLGCFHAFYRLAW